MGKLIKARAWCNGEVAYLSWAADGPIADCVGFMITRVHETGPDAGQRRILPTWIGFTDQSNPDWLDQDSSVWPIQQYEWRDLTLRRSRDTAKVRPIDFRVHYEITPVGLAGPGGPALPASPTAPFLDENGSPRYEGPQHPLAKVGDPIDTPPIDVTHDYAGVRATYTNGILSTQNLLQQLEAVQGNKPRNVAAGPITKITPGLLKTLLQHIPIKDDEIRTFLTADVLGFLLSMIDRAEKKKGAELYMALYELHDPELIERLTKLTKAGKAHVILSTAGATNPNSRDTPPNDKQPVAWDTENHPARSGLHNASAANVQDRLFNNTAHIGHNKFAVYVENGVAKSVLTGSTNWTETGLCTQSNNAIIIDDIQVAGQYLACWKRLFDDPQPAGQELTITYKKQPLMGFGKNNGVQGAVLRAANATPPKPDTLDGGTTVEVLFSPNTKAKTKNADSPTPIDLSRVYSLMEHANHAILFLAFLPGYAGVQNIISEAAKLAVERPTVLVQGAVSDPKALPPRAKAGEPTTYTAPDGTTKKLPQPAVWWPGGDASRVAVIRAAAVTTQTGDLRPELLSAGHAIIHDKIIVIDPLDGEACTVITGSHNFGYKASYQNDENLLIIRGNQALAIAYAVHVLDVYDHYLMRAKLSDSLRKSLIETGKPPVANSGGFLRTTPDWQARWFKPHPVPTSRDYFLS